jgi:hypothetical protein
MHKVFTTTLLIVLNVICSTAQVKNTRIVEAESSGGKVNVAFNSKNSQYITASLGNAIYYSVNGGAAWERSAATFPAGAHSALIADSKGDLYYFLQTTEGGVNKIISYTSGDGGKTWSAGVPVNAESAKDQVAPNATLDDKNNLYLTYIQFDKYASSDANCLSHVQLTTSSSGKKWSTPQELSQSPGNCIDDHNTVAGSTAVVSFDGKEYCTWSNQNKIYLDRSFNGKLWLTNDIAIIRQSEGCDENVTGGKRCSSAPVLSTDRSKSPYKGSLYLVWSDWMRSDQDVLFVRSHNFGDNWTSLLKINDVEAGHQYNPWLAVDQTTGYVYILYFNRDEEGMTDIYLSYSTDGGSSFKNVKVSESAFKTDGALNASCHVAAGKGTIVAVWTRSDQGKTSILTTTIKHEDLVKIK